MDLIIMMREKSLVFSFSTRMAELYLKWTSCQTLIEIACQINIFVMALDSELAWIS
jgi:hypothetical protein